MSISINPITKSFTFHGFDQEKTLEIIRMYMYYVCNNDPWLLPFVDSELPLWDNVTFYGALRLAMCKPEMLKAVEFIKEKYSEKEISTKEKKVSKKKAKNDKYK